MVDEVLVALELDRAVSSDILVEIAGVGVVEYVCSQVEYPVALVRILQDVLVHWSLYEMLVELVLGDEVVSVEVSLSDDAHVEEDEAADNPGCDSLALICHEVLFCAKAPVQDAGGQEYEHHAYQRILAEKHEPVGLKCVHEDVLLAAVGWAGKAAAETGGAYETEAGGDGQGDERVALEFLLVDVLLLYVVKHQEAQHRQGELQYHQGHRYRPELVVERHVVEPELGEAHEMVAEGESDTDYRRDQQPPFFLALVHAQSEHEEEDGDGSHVHRSGRERLRAPVERQGLRNLVEIALSGVAEQLYGLGTCRVDCGGRRSAVVVRNHHVRELFPAV